MTLGFPNKNSASKLFFRMAIQRLPLTSYNVQKIYVPGLFVPEVVQSNPFANIKHPGEKMMYEECKVTFAIDNDYKNWNEIYTWMTGIGRPESGDQYAEVLRGDPALGLGITSSVTIIGDDSSRRPVVEFELTKSFPTALTGFTYDTTLNTETNDLITATVSFAYTNMIARSVSTE